MIGARFSQVFPENDKRTVFEKLLELFLEIIIYTNGDVEEAFQWMEEIDKEHRITTPDYTLDDFRRDLEDLAYIQNKPDGNGSSLSAKTEKILRQKALEQIFGNLKKSNSGQHRSLQLGQAGEQTDGNRPFEFGDPLSQINFNSSIQNAQLRTGLDNFNFIEKDLVVQETEHRSQMSTVLMIDISHSMVLYGEDRITPAKKVAMALSELILTQYPKDSLDIVVFGNDAWQVQIKDLPFLTVGPFHTNTVAGLELAMDLLRKRKTKNKQIFMITDGKPTCLRLPNGKYYQNSMGHDPKIINKTIDLAIQCKKLGISITTFMIAQDPYLQKFVQDFTTANQGKAFYSGLQGLGEFIFKDYQQSKKKK